MENTAIKTFKRKQFIDYVCENMPRKENRKITIGNKSYYIPAYKFIDLVQDLNTFEDMGQFIRIYSGKHNTIDIWYC